jgi:hypothetical protein
METQEWIAMRWRQLCSTAFAVVAELCEDYRISNTNYRPDRYRAFARELGTVRGWVAPFEGRRERLREDVEGVLAMHEVYPTFLRHAMPDLEAWYLGLPLVALLDHDEPSEYPPVPRAWRDLETPSTLPEVPPARWTHEGL